MKNWLIKILIFSISLIGLTDSARAQSLCVDLFSEDFKPKALLPGADFVLSDKFIEYKKKALEDDRFKRFLEKYPAIDLNDAVALFYYTGSLASHLNPILAAKEYIPKYRQAEVYILSALKHIPLEQKEVLYRGLKAEEVNKLKAYNEGMEFEISEFKSTSRAFIVAQGFAYYDGYTHIMEIKNALAYDLKDISRFPTEREYLIAPRSRFKLVEIKVHEDQRAKQKIYVVEMIHGK